MVCGPEKMHGRGNCSGVGNVSAVGVALFLGEDDDDVAEEKAAKSCKLCPE